VAFSEPARRQGLIVCRTTADIKSLQDIKGRRFSFGPPGDPVLDAAAKETLIEAGVPLDELIREWLALDAQTGVTVYSQQYHISSRESAFSIVYGLLTEVGVIEAAEYEAYPETGGSLLLRQFAKEDFRVLGRTRVVRMDSLPEGPLLAASDADPQLVENMVAFLLSINATDRGVLLAAGLGGFRAPGADVATEMERLAALSPASAPAEDPATQVPQ
jgi:hypothetical protein